NRAEPAPEVVPGECRVAVDGVRVVVAVGERPERVVALGHVDNAGAQAIQTGVQQSEATMGELVGPRDDTGEQWRRDTRAVDIIEQALGTERGLVDHDSTPT